MKNRFFTILAGGALILVTAAGLCEAS